MPITPLGEECDASSLPSSGDRQAGTNKEEGVICFHLEREGASAGKLSE